MSAAAPFAMPRPPPGMRLIDPEELTLGALIGEGGFGKVCRSLSLSIWRSIALQLSCRKCWVTFTRTGDKHIVSWADGMTSNRSVFFAWW